MERTVFAGGLGTLSLRWLLLLVRIMQDVVHVDNIFAAPVSDYNRNTTGAAEDELTRRLGSRWIGVGTNEISSATGFHSDPTIAIQQMPEWGGPTQRMIDFLSKDAWDDNLTLPTGIIIFGPPSGGHYTPMKWFVEHLAQRALSAIRLGMTTLPSDDVDRRALSDDPEYIEEIARAGTFDSVLVTDNRSRISMRDGLDHQDTLLMTGLASLMGAQSHFDSERSIADAVRDLCRYGPYLGTGFGLRGMVPLERPVPARSSWQRFKDKLSGTTLPLPYPRFYLPDTVKQTIGAVEQAVSDPNMRAVEFDEIAEADYRERPVYVVVSLPLSLGDYEDWERVVAQVGSHFARKRPNLTFVYAPANGANIPDFPTDWRVQATTFFPMQRIKTLHEIVEQEARIRLRRMNHDAVN